MIISFDRRHIALLLIAGLLMAASCGTAEKSTEKLPFGAMDTPRSGDTIKGNAALVGWALSEAGIKEILVYVDRSYVMSGQINVQRPDVAKVYPAIENSQRSGWNIQLDTSTLAPGQHEIVARAIARDGSLRDIGSVLVTVVR